MTPQDVENYKAIVLSAVENNREGCITDIYLDIMSTNGDRLRHNTHFHYEYQANYHRAYQEVNGHPYPYGGTLTRNAKINYTLPPKKDGCCES